MAGCAQRPRCHKTKSRRCIKPNPWLSYLSQHGGKGHTRAELMYGYREWKKVTFRRFTSSSRAHVIRRQEKLCDLFAPGSKPETPKTKVQHTARSRNSQGTVVDKKQALEREKERKARDKRTQSRDRERRNNLANERRKKASEERKKKASDERKEKALEQQRKQASEERRKKASEERRQRKQASEERRKKASEERRQRKQASEERKKKASEERKEKALQQQRKQASDERRKKISDERKKQALDERNKKASEEKRKASDERRKKASEEKRNSENREELDRLRQRFCKDFRGPAVTRLAKISADTVTLFGKLDPQTFEPYPPAYDPLLAYRLNPPANGDCMWASIAGGLFGSSAQWKSIHRAGESLCDRLMVWFQEYKAGGRRRGFDLNFVKWIFVKQLRGMPLSSEKKTLLDAYNAQDEDESGNPVEKVDITDKESWPTQKEAYNEIMNLYEEEVMDSGYWGGPVEIRFLSKALYPLVDLAFFVTPNKNETKGKHAHYDPVTNKKSLIDGPVVKHPRMQFSVYSRPKPASVLLLLNDKRRSHYELLTVEKRRKDFLLLESQVPAYMYLPYEK